jgi:cobalt/nickel transport system permease protein
MHIPDGFVDIPVAAATGAVALGVVAVSVRKVTRDLNERSVPMLGVAAAFIFAAQMLNFPVAGGTSGHLIGAMLIAALLGPYAALIVLTTVLVVQSLLMADGGITALGANVFNMAVIGGVVAYLAFIGLKRLLPKTATGYFLSLAVASWFSVVLASVACSFELALSGTVPLGVALPAMTSVHMIIGLGEALITSTVVAAVLASRPDLVKTYDVPRGALAGRRTALFGQRGRLWGFVVGAVVVSLALAVLVSPFASSSPDGLEKVAGDKGFEQAAAEEPLWDEAPIPDYVFPGIQSEGVATAVAGAIGAICLLVLVLVIGRVLGRRGLTARPEIAGASGHGDGSGPTSASGN